MENEFKPTHLATVCKCAEITLESKDKILILLPVVVAEGIIDEKKNFVDKDGDTFLPIYDSYLNNNSIGYILGVSFAEILSRGKQILIENYGKKVPISEFTPSDIISSYKEEYVQELEYLTWYYNLSEIVPVLSCDDNEEFYDEYNLSIDREKGTITTKRPYSSLSPEAYANFNKEENDLEDEEKNDSHVAALVKPQITRRELIAEVKKDVISQDEAVETIASAVYKPFALGSSDIKTNILVYGPTGVGKTFILETIASKLGLPFYATSIANFSATGYVGNSIDDIYIGLFEAAGRNVEKLESGAILYLDEVDKLVLGESHNSDVKSQVYNELLTLYQHEGKVTFKPSEGRGAITFDKKNLIVVSSGSFAKLGGSKKQKIGFNEEINSEKDKQIYTADDFIKFGIPPEWMGRQDICVPLKSLTENDLYKIFKESNSSPYVKHMNILKAKGITLNISDESLKYMSRKALSLKKGARSLRGIFDIAIAPEINHIVDEMDENNIETSSYDVSDEAVVKRLEKYHG